MKYEPDPNWGDVCKHCGESESSHDDGNCPSGEQTDEAAQ